MILGQLYELLWRGLAPIGKELFEDMSTQVLDSDLTEACFGLD